MTRSKEYSGLHVTRNLPFERVAEVGPIGVYESQVRGWIFSSAHILAGGRQVNTDHGMALLATQLMFFEPHGAYLLGLEKMTCRRGELETNKKHFFAGFEEFLMWRQSKIKDGKPTPDIESIYRWMRCGLFHMSHLSSSIMIGVGPEKSLFFKNIHLPGTWLVSPWVMLPELEQYFNDYIERLRKKEQPLLDKFGRAYDFFFAKSMAIIQARMRDT